MHINLIKITEASCLLSDIDHVVIIIKHDYKYGV